MYTFKYPELNIDKKVKDTFELREVVYKMHDEFDLRGSNWDWIGAKIYKGEELIGRVAYNSMMMTTRYYCYRAYKLIVKLYSLIFTRNM